MGNDFRGISVKILGKEYQVTCPEGKEAALVDAACFLDKKMAEIKGSARVFGLERISVMAALNLAHELILQKNNASDYIDCNNKQLQNMHDKLEDVLDKTEANAKSVNTKEDLAENTFS